MSQTARDAYLATQVMTATPQKLHLMLIEGALRSLHLAGRAWEEGREEEACEGLIRGQEVVSEMLGGVSTSDQPVARRLVGLYVYLCRTLAEAQMERAPDKLADVVRLLEFERETWTEICAKFGAQRESAPPPASVPAPAMLKPPTFAMPSETTRGGFSFQA